MNPNTKPLLIAVESSTSTVEIKPVYSMTDPINLGIKKLSDSLPVTEEIDVLLARIKHEVEAYASNLEAAINADEKKKEIVHNQYIQYKETVHNQYILEKQIRAQEIANNQEIWENLLIFKDSAKTSNFFTCLKKESLLKEYSPAHPALAPLRPQADGDNVVSIVKAKAEPLNLLDESSIDIINTGESALIPIKDAMSTIGIDISLVDIVLYVPTYLLYRGIVNSYCPYGGVFILMNLNLFLQQDIQFVL